MTATAETSRHSTSAEETSTERGYYSISEVAALLGVSRVSIWRWISSGRLPATRLGHRTVRVQRQDLERILSVQQRATGAATLPGHGDGSAPAAPRAEWLMANSQDHHRVLFYDAEQFLLEGVAEFIAAALNAGERGIVVATPEHRLGIQQRLRAAGVDVSAAQADGRFRELDAVETLARFMRDDLPDPNRFADVVSGLVGRSASGGLASRVFGEMVAVLVAQGNSDAAIALEALWNQAQKRHSFSLLCAYRMEQLGGASLAQVLADICQEHSGVVPAESYSALPDPNDRLRQVVALQQKAASLERALAAERAARDQAEAALRVREEFLSIASHELRTPITVLGAQAQVSLRRLQRSGRIEPERAAQAWRTIGAQAEKLGRLVGQLLDLSRLDAGKLTLEPQPTDLSQLVSQVISSTCSLSERHTITLTAPATVDAVVDPLRLEQVLSNLLDNAIKYSPEGGSIEVQVVQPTAAAVEISVRDYGLGIAPEKRKRIFERFYQAHDAGHRSGMGLGLYVCRQIVEQHRGHMHAEFPADGGTRIVVALPLAVASVRPSVAAD